LDGGGVTFAACPVHRLGTLDPVARNVHGHAPGHQVPEHLSVSVERGPMGRRVAPFVPEAERLAAALLHSELESIVITGLDGFQQWLVPLILGAVHVQRIGRTPIVHAVVVIIVIVVVNIYVVSVVVVAIAIAVATGTATAATAHHVTSRSVIDFFPAYRVVGRENIV